MKPRRCSSSRMMSRSLLAAGLLMMTVLTPVLSGSARAQHAPAPPMEPPGQATPLIDTGSNEQLAQFLSLAPDILATASPDNPLVLQFGDAKTQLAAVGVTAPTSTTGEAFSAWNRAIRSVALPDVVLTNGLRPEFANAFGFDVVQVDAGMTVGAPPATITFLRGRFDENRLRAAWQKSGYHEVQVDGTTVFSLSAEPTVDLSNPIGRMATSRFNNAVILSHGVVVFTPSLDLMKHVLGVSTGAEPSLAQNPQLSALVASVDSPLVSVAVIQGSALKLTNMFGRAPADVARTITSDVQATGTIGQITLALFGITPGGPLSPSGGAGTPVPAGPNATFEIRLLMADDQAAEAATRVIPKRLDTLSSIRTRQPYSDLVTLADISVAPDAPVVAVSLGFAPGYVPAIWGTMVTANDLLFIAWSA